MSDCYFPLQHRDFYNQKKSHFRKRHAIVMHVKSDKQLIVSDDYVVHCMFRVPPSQRKKSNQIEILSPDINTWHYRSTYVMRSIHWHEDYVIRGIMQNSRGTLL
jgi:hypothetical protein